MWLGATFTLSLDLFHFSLYPVFWLLRAYTYVFTSLSFAFLGLALALVIHFTVPHFLLPQARVTLLFEAFSIFC